MNTAIWNHLPRELLTTKIIPMMTTRSQMNLFKSATNDLVMCRYVLLPAARFIPCSHISGLSFYIAVAALKSLPSAEEFYEFYNAGYHPLPQLHRLGLLNLNEYLRCVVQRGDWSILKLVVGGGCCCCVDTVFSFLIDNGHVDAFRYMIWNFGLTMRVIFRALYTRNRVIMTEIMKALETSIHTFLPTLNDNIEYYRCRYDEIPHIKGLSDQLQDAKTRRWLAKQLRYLGKLMKMKNLRALIH